MKRQGVKPDREGERERESTRTYVSTNLLHVNVDDECVYSMVYIYMYVYMIYNHPVSQTQGFSGASFDGACGCRLWKTTSAQHSKKQISAQNP